MQTLDMNLGQDGAAAADLVKDTTTQDFIADVIEASRHTPVLVDFWAPWCGPCKQLTPILEKAVKVARGAVRLVKLNIDEHPAIAGQMGIRSIPAVFAFRDGRPVDGFMGALPESQVKAFIERLAGPGAAIGAQDDLAAAEEAFEAGDLSAAAQIYAAILQQDGQSAEAIAGLAKCYITSGDLARAEQTLALTPPDKQLASPITSAKAMLELARKTGQAGDARALEAKVAANPGDLQARYDLALALAARGDRQGAAEQLLAVIARNKTWNEEAARKQLVEFFDAWGPKDPATIEGRQKLSSLLFS